MAFLAEGPRLQAMGQVPRGPWSAATRHIRVMSWLAGTVAFATPGRRHCHHKNPINPVRASNVRTNITRDR